MTDQMKAISYDSFGDVDRLHYGDRPMPVVGPGEALIKVKSAAVNPVDWKVLGGHLVPLFPHELPIIPGWDVAGVVESVGPDTPEFQAGDEVLAYARKDWISQGTFAEYVSVPARAITRKPAALSWHQAAGLPLAGSTAYRTLELLRVGKGDTVLIHGAAGGVGAFGVQLAVAAGARVVGTASTANHERLRALGAEPVTYGDGLIDRVLASAPGGVDMVADFVGDVLEATLGVLAPGGRHASIADAAVAEHGGLVVWVRPDATQLTALAALADEGKLTVPVAEIFPLEQAADAFRLSQAGHTHGKIIIHVSD